MNQKTLLTIISASIFSLYSINPAYSGEPVKNNVVEKYDENRSGAWARYQRGIELIKKGMIASWYDDTKKIGERNNFPMKDLEEAVNEGRKRQQEWNKKHDKNSNLYK